ncbi:MAG: AAA family ATPase [Actinobacteria bacterium]|nr:AAA family ATPase [Actinomycetota bacterium]
MAAHGPGSVLGLAPSAAAADVLSESLGVDCENTAKWLHETVGPGAQYRADAHHRLTKSARRARAASAKRNIAARLHDINTAAEKWAMRPNQLVIVDEASLAGTLSLAALAHQAETAGAKLLLVGDHGQLSAVDAGGALRMLARDPNTVTLNTVWRFSNEWEREASLNLRRGRIDTLDTYTEHGRTHEGSHADMLDAAYQAWLNDTTAGHTSLLIAADNATVNTLNHRARQDLIATGHVEPDGVPLRGDTLAGVGDRIVTRENNRRLSDGNEWVHNGDLFTVIARHQDGALTVQRDPDPDGNARVVTLPGDYVAAHVNLAYATTAYRAQGSTVDTAHTVATTGLSRETLYVAMTRGRHANHVYAAIDQPGDDPDDSRHLIQPSTGREVLDGILRRSDADQSATESIIAAQQSAQSMATLIPIYEHIAHQHSTLRWQPILRTHVQDETTVEAIRGSDAWPKITGLLRSLNLTGIDAEAAFADALERGFDNDGDADPGAVIAGRVARTLNNSDTPPQPVRYLAGMIVPAEPADDPAVQAAIDSAAHAIHTRAESLVHEALATQQPWITTIGPQPTSPDRNSTWWAAAQAAATYRDRWGVIADTPLGGTTRLDRDQRRDRQRAQRAIDNLTAQPTSPSETPEPTTVSTTPITR